MSELIGKTVGQYQIVEQIGQGGMATIFKAYQPSIDRYVAVKILPSQFAADPNFVKRFAHEAKSIAALEHPHILPVHDFGTEGKVNYMVMRYIKGGTLSDLMGKPMPHKKLVEIVGNIARALDYAHQQGIIHRDIKPSNVLIDEHGEALLTDFGIAKIVEGSGSTQLTAAGSILGTPAYMAPEQAKSQNIDGRTDIYSLGVVLYELLTGRPPYQAETPFAIVLKHLNDPLPPPRTVDPNIPEALERVVLKAMAKDPDQRFETAGQMEQALHNALKEIETGVSVPAGPPVSRPKTMHDAPPQTMAPPAKKGSSTGPLVIVGVIVVALLCVLGGGGVALFGLMSSSEENSATSTPGSISGTGGDTSSGGDETSTGGETSTGDESPATATSTLAPAPPTATPTLTESSSDSIAGNPDELDGGILFAERFDSNERDWFVGTEDDEYGSSVAEIVDGRYRLSQDATQSVAWWLSPDDDEFFDNFVLSMDAAPVEQNGSYAYGFVFYKGFDDQFYSFEIDDAGYVINLYTNGEWEALVDYTETPAINGSGSNQLMVEAVSPFFTFFINGQEVATIEDNTLDGGSIGVILEVFEEGDNVVVDFDNLIIREIGGETAQATGDYILFEDYFDSDANGWSTGQFEDEYTVDDIAIEDGKYTLNIMAMQSAYVERNPPNQEFSDFILTLEATPYDTAEHYSYGIAFRENAEGHGYSFEIGNDGLYAVLLFDGEWKKLKDWSSTDAIRIGETNELTIIADGEIMTFFVNGQELTTLEDDVVSAGTIGLVVHMFDDDTVARVDFDNLVIRYVY